MLIYLLNKQEMPFDYSQMMEIDERSTPYENLVKSRVYKKEHSLTQMAHQIENSHPNLMKFIMYVENMSFEE